MLVRWVRQALRNLEQAHRYIAVDDPQAGRQLVLRVQAAVSQLEIFPMMGRSGRVEGMRELVIPGTLFTVIYRVQGKTTQILRILHASKRYSD